MGATKIEWCSHTWNPAIGCSPVSEGCRHCYAARLAHRMAHHPNPKVAERYRGTTRRLSDGRIAFNGRLNVCDAVDKLHRELQRARKPRRIFVESMGDLFHPYLTDVVIHDVYKLAEAHRRHIFMLLTKRPEEIQGRLYGPPGYYFGGGDYLPNVWHMATVENQDVLASRADALCELRKAACGGWPVIGLSCEPLLGPLDLAPWIEDLDWVIVGGETGPGARPMHPDWVREIRDHCVSAGVPFLFQHWGEWSKTTQTTCELSRHCLVAPDGDYSYSDDGYATLTLHGNEWNAAMTRVGRKDAGRLLDGREWNEIPEGR